MPDTGAATDRIPTTWGKFPHSNEIQLLLDSKSIANFVTTNIDAAPPTPFHFTLLVLQALYTRLQRDGTDASSIRNPPIEDARRTELRAIAYFSWHSEDRMFLARRVYPTYFDFLTYSHVPEGWGALGLLTESFRGAND